MIRGDRESSRESSSKKFDFAHRSDAMAHPRSRELRAVKIPTTYDAWRPPKRRKNDSENFDFWCVGNQFFVISGGFWRSYGRTNVKINCSVKLCSRDTYSEFCTNKNHEKKICDAKRTIVIYRPSHKGQPQHLRPGGLGQGRVKAGVQAESRSSG